MLLPGTLARVELLPQGIFGHKRPAGLSGPEPLPSSEHRGPTVPEGPFLSAKGSQAIEMGVTPGSQSGRLPKELAGVIPGDRVTPALLSTPQIPVSFWDFSGSFTAALENKDVLTTFLTSGAWPLGTQQMGGSCSLLNSDSLLISSHPSGI